MTDPYRPPKAPELETPGPARPWLGVAVGFLVDIVGTFVSTTVIVIVYGIVLRSSGVPVEELEERISGAVSMDAYGLSLTAAGVTMSFLGGFTCVRFARSADPRPPVALAVLVVGVGFLASDFQSFLSAVVMVGLTVFAIAAGAIYARRPFSKNG